MVWQEKIKLLDHLRNIFNGLGWLHANSSHVDTPTLGTVQQFNDTTELNVTYIPTIASQNSIDCTSDVSDMHRALFCSGENLMSPTSYSGANAITCIIHKDTSD